MSAEAELAAALEALYALFSEAPSLPSGGACPHCSSEAEQAVLHRKPRRELKGGHLTRSAFDTDTSSESGASHYRYFLPRILELSAGSELDWFPGLEVSVVADQLLSAGWDAWPVAERAAVHRYAHARWALTLSGHPYDRSAWDALMGVSVLAGGVAPLLAMWEAEEGLNGALQLANALVTTGASLHPGGFPAGWQDDEGWDVVSNWMRARAREAALMRAAALCPPESARADMLAEGLEVWRKLEG